MQPPSDHDAPRHLTGAEVAAAAYGGAVYGGDAARDAAARDDHLADCAECQHRVDRARRLDAEAGALLRTLDGATLPFTADDVRARARDRMVPIRRRWPVLPAAAAAGIVVCAAGAVALAFPASRLGQWLQHVTSSSVISQRREPARPSAPAPASVDASVSGVALVPTGPLTIVFQNRIPTSLRVVYCDTTLATIRRPARSTVLGAHVRFRVSSNRIMVLTGDIRDTFELTLPSNANDVRITDRDQRVIATLSTPVARASTPGTHGCRAPVTLPLTSR